MTNNNDEKKLLLKELREDASKKNWNDYFLKLYSLIYDFPSYNDDYYQDCNFLIENGFFNTAETVLNYLKKQDITKSKKIITNFLKNKIDEARQYDEISDEEKETYQEILEKGSIAYHQRNYALAYDYYTAGLYIFDDPTFLYYIGKIHYKRHQYIIAEQYLKEYMKKGCRKYQKAALFLSKIYEHKQKYSEMNRMSEQAKILEPFSEDHFILDNLFLRPNEDKYDLKPPEIIEKIKKYNIYSSETC